MISFLRNILIEIRPRQWVKNLTIFSFLLFSKQFFIFHQFLVVFYSFIAFTLLTSSVYIFNDIIDYDSDKKNPEKKRRPIASGKISKNTGIVIGIIFFISSCILAYNIGEYLLGMCLLYFVLMMAYSFFLKNLEIIDALVIAGGFVIRVLAGGFIINVTDIYSWLVIVTISISLLLAFGKRRSEVTLMGATSATQRKVLASYPTEMLNSLISALVATTFLSYILFTFNIDLVPARVFLQTQLVQLPITLLRTSHLLKITIPVVFYGIARYVYIIYTNKKGGTPENVLFHDIPLLGTILIWIILVFILLYGFH